MPRSAKKQHPLVQWTKEQQKTIRTACLEFALTVLKISDDIDEIPKSTRQLAEIAEGAYKVAADAYSLDIDEIAASGSGSGGARSRRC